jgi:hypothetical protein
LPHRKISTIPFFFSVSQRPSGEAPGWDAAVRAIAHSATSGLMKRFMARNRK